MEAIRKIQNFEICDENTLGKYDHSIGHKIIAFCSIVLYKIGIDSKKTKKKI